MVKIFLISRYVSDLFYMAPIYHQAFTKLDKLLVVDSTDLTIVSDIKVPLTGVKVIGKTQLMGLGWTFKFSRHM